MVNEAQQKACSCNENTSLQKYKKLVMLAGIASVSVAVTFIVIKVVVWLISSSTVIFASLTDSIFDLLASLVNLLALRFSLTPPDKEHRFGHFKSQALASVAQAGFIGGSPVLLVIHGVERCITPQNLVHVDLAILVSVVSIVFTILLVLFQTYVYNRTQSEAIGADRLHYLSDVSLNIGVIAALILDRYGYKWADGLFASLIGVYILKGAYSIGFRAIQTLLDKSLSQKSLTKILNQINSVHGVKSIHDLKTHRAGPMVFIQGHIVMDENLSLKKAHDIVNEVELLIRKDFQDVEFSFHMEPDLASTYESVQFEDKPHLNENGEEKLTTVQR